MTSTNQSSKPEWWLTQHIPVEGCYSFEMVLHVQVLRGDAVRGIHTLLLVINQWESRK